MGDSSFPPWWAVVIFGGVLLAFALFVRKQDAGWFERLLSSDRSARYFGLCCVLFGSFVAWILVWSPLTDALAHRRSVSIYRGAVAIPAVLFGLSGAYFLLFLYVIPKLAAAWHETGVVSDEEE